MTWGDVGSPHGTAAGDTAKAAGSELGTHWRMRVVIAGGKFNQIISPRNQPLLTTIKVTQNIPNHNQNIQHGIQHRRTTLGNCWGSRRAGTSGGHTHSRQSRIVNTGYHMRCLSLNIDGLNVGDGGGNWKSA